jgi:hypothetical protein
MTPLRFTIRLALSFVFSATLWASTPDVKGKWKWQFERNGESQEITMVLKQDGSKITGKLTGPDGRAAEVHDGKAGEDGKVSFFIDYERDGNTHRVDFHGQAEGDKITGKIEFTNQNDEKRDMDWVARREPARQTRTVSGTWTSSFKRQDGTSMDSKLTLKEDAEKLSGSQEFNGNESEIRNGQVHGDVLSFDIVRERDGRTVTAKYRGKIQGDGRIKGEIESDWTGEVRHLPWEAVREKN